MTRQKPSTPSGDTQRELDERLNEALEETFPASDPIAVSPPTTQGTPAPVPPIDGDDS